MGVAWLHDEPIAAQFWFVFDRRAYIFKLAYDEEHAKMSAGTILTARLMQHVLDEDRVVEVDFGTGDDNYKKSWMTHCRERAGIRAMNLASPAGLAEAARTYGGAIKRKLQALARRALEPGRGATTSTN
jgi:CelD/BcsL family acetyltransferase involved in cellulose biosynthesis